MPQHLQNCKKNLDSIQLELGLYIREKCFSDKLIAEERLVFIRKKVGQRSLKTFITDNKRERKKTMAPQILS